MGNKQVSINFCGGCNPRIERGHIATELKSLLAAEDYEVSFNQETADLMVYLSGCTANCAEPTTQVEVAFVTIAGTTVDRRSIEEHLLVEEIMNKVREYFS